MKQIKKYLPTTLLILFLLGFFWMVLDYNGVSIHREIDRTIEAGIYANGVQAGKTTVTVSGEYYPHLFRPDSFRGKFSISEMPETESDSVNAEITWYHEIIDGIHYEYQLITYRGYQAGDFHIVKTDGAYQLSINREMDQIVWAIGSDRILATSPEAYRDYLENQN